MSNDYGLNPDEQKLLDASLKLGDQAIERHTRGISLACATFLICQTKNIDHVDGDWVDPDDVIRVAGHFERYIKGG